MFFKRHVERVRIDVCNLGKIKVILLGAEGTQRHLNPKLR